MFGFASLGQERVDLVDEDHCRLVATSHCEQRSHHLLAVAHPFRRQGRCAYTEEGRLALRSDTFTLKNKTFFREWQHSKTDRFGVGCSYSTGIFHVILTYQSFACAGRPKQQNSFGGAP
jgi:hypothetical protein